MTNNNDNNMEKTQSIPRVGNDTQVKRGHVRELDPVDVEGRLNQGVYNGVRKEGNNQQGYRVEGGADPFSSTNITARARQPLDRGSQETQFIPVQNGMGNANRQQGQRSFQQNYPGNNGNYPNNRQPMYDGGKEEEKSNGTKIALLIVGFLVALFLGMTVSGYMHEKDIKENNAKLEQQMVRQQAQQNEQDRQSLKNQKAQLERQIKELQRQQQEAQSTVDTLRGQDQQRAKDDDAKSALGKMADMLSGSDKKQQQQSNDNRRQEEAAQSKVESIGESIRSAQDAIDDVNDKIDKLNEMKQTASNVKNKVTEVYDENQGTVDTILHYAGQGLSMVLGLLK